MADFVEKDIVKHVKIWLLKGVTFQ